jgi:hypothetical protein
VLRKDCGARDTDQLRRAVVLDAQDFVARYAKAEEGSAAEQGRNPLV